MEHLTSKEKRIFEGMLIVLILGMTTVFLIMHEHGLIILNLFFLPVVLCGYFLGRGSAGVLALLSVLTVTIAASLFTPRFGGYTTPVRVGLALALWAAALGLTALLMGTLCDERTRTVNELHKAYVGVVEVLFKYLQSSDPRTKARSIRIAELSQSVAREMRLTRKQIDDIRVAALLRDLESVEITTQLVSRAMTTLERDTARAHSHTFQGTDLVHSLGSVLDGALPLIVSQNDELRDCLDVQPGAQGGEVLAGAQIIGAVRAFDALVGGDAHRAPMDASTAIKVLRQQNAYPAEVIDAIASASARCGADRQTEPVAV